jgi:TolB-like protein
MFLAWVYDWTPEGIRRTASSGPLGWLPVMGASVFLIAASAGLFWLINPSGVARMELTGVAVLPCRYHGDEDFVHRGIGLAELLNDGLAHSAHLFVPSFDSVQRLSELNPETSRLAESLGVSRLIECRVGGEADRVDLTVSIVDAETDHSETVTATAFRSLEIADALDAVEAALLVRLGVPADSTRTFGTQLTSSLEDLDHYLLGRHATRNDIDRNLAEARQHFRAAQQGGWFALARLGEAEVMLSAMEIESPPTPAAARASLNAVRLMLDEIDNRETVPAGLFAARLRLANLDGLSGMVPVADEALRQQWLESAVALRPSFAEPYRLFGEYLRSSGRDGEAAEYLAKAAELAPAPQRADSATGTTW